MDTACQSHHIARVKSARLVASAATSPVLVQFVLYNIHFYHCTFGGSLAKILSFATLDATSPPC